MLIIVVWKFFVHYLVMLIYGYMHVFLIFLTWLDINDLDCVLPQQCSSFRLFL